MIVLQANLLALLGWAHSPFAFGAMLCCIKQAFPPSAAERREQLLEFIMESTMVESVIVRKTKELCQALLDEPGINSIRERIDAFMDDSQARTQYENLVAKGQALQEKQHNSMPLSGDEISDFEQQRDSLLGNPVARGFLDAQEELQQVQQSIQKYVSKTLELGRMPTEEDLCGGGSCGHGCGCGH